jgi:4,5-DOPA dioxygenase extradiol
MILYLSHGGGPLPLLGDPAHQELNRCLQEIATSIPVPSSILVVSAHWEESSPHITASAHPKLIYDYSGFPAAAYHIKYPASGHPQLAQSIYDSFTAAKINSFLDNQRGFDHGLFVPLSIMYPKANIPCVQLSLLNNLDPLAHINLGKALQHLQQENVLVIGSGFSFHNMRAFFSPDTAETTAMNGAFQQWLQDTCANTSISEQEREKRLVNWATAPFARYCHPREEHLLPLHVCYGMAGRACTKAIELEIMNKKASMFLW